MKKDPTGGPDVPAPESLPLRVLSRLVALLTGLAMALAASGLLLSLVLIGWAVVMRYVFNAAPVWVDEVVGFALVVTVLLGAAQTFRRGEHIGVDVLVSRLSPTGRRWAQAWAAVVTGVVGVVLMVNGWETVALARMLGLLTEGHLEWPIWWLMMLMPVGGALLLLAAVESVWRALAGQALTFRLPMGSRARERRGAMTIALLFWA
ncbi:MAG: TRAP transporter small permease [Burkholderiaceae bacterium]